MYERYLNLPYLLKKKSFFLFGPRSTRKTTLIHKVLPSAKVYNLLHPETHRRLHLRPQLLEEENKRKSKIIVIDEIQKHVGFLTF